MDYITFRNCIMQDSEYKIPHALVGCEKEEDFKLLITANNQQIHFFEEETGKHFEGNFFKTIKDLEFNSLNQFNVNLYRSFARFFEKEIGKYPSDEITLWSFNNAYRIAMDGLREPLRFNINIYEEGLSVVRIQEMWIPRDRHEVAAIFCMTCSILSQETTPTAEIEILMDKIRRKYVNEIEYFLPPARKQGHDKGTLFDSVEETKTRASEFMDLFHGTDLPLVNNSQQNIINKTIKAKCKEWFGKRTPINASAVYRFLYNDCKLNFKSEEKTWRTFFRKFYTQ